MAAGMSRQEMIALAAPPCHVCGEPVARVEMRWHWERGEWVIGPCFMVCGAAHRVEVEPFPPEG